MITQYLRERLPSYMVPAYLEQLAVIPMTTQRQGRPQGAAGADRARAVSARPASTSRRPPTTERILADALARTLGVDRVSVDANFFDDLGANSLLMAQFSARVRKQTRCRVAVDQATST